MQELQAGTISLVIGTHSLIADSVEFLALRLAVIDEQHRFGVIQRGRFNSKVVYSYLCVTISKIENLQVLIFSLSVIDVLLIFCCSVMDYFILSWDPLYHVACFEIE